MTAEFVTLTLSGILVNLVGIGTTAWLSHRRLRAHLDRVTAGQTGDIRQLTDAQTANIRQLTDTQTAELMRRRWWQRRPVRSNRWKGERSHGTRRLGGLSHGTRNLARPETSVNRETTVKSLHLTKIRNRHERVLERLPSYLGRWKPGPMGAEDLRRLLEVDLPEMIEAVRDANRERDEARQALAARAGTKYQVTVSSEAPIAVHRTVVQPGT